VTMVLLCVVILTTLFGTHMPGRNLGVMLTWVVWLFVLTAVLTPLGGRIWCLACPLPVLGQILQRRAVTGVRTGSTRGYNNRFFGLSRAWPRWLRNDWPRTFGLLILGTFSTVLAAVPRLSGWLVLGLVVLATAMALICELRAFCRYVCPVNAFVGLYSKMSNLALRAADPAVCARCRGRASGRGKGGLGTRRGSRQTLFPRHKAGGGWVEKSGSCFPVAPEAPGHGGVRHGNTGSRELRGDRQ